MTVAVWLYGCVAVSLCCCGCFVAALWLCGCFVVVWLSLWMSLWLTCLGVPATAGAAALRGTKGLIKAIYTALSRHKGSTRVHQAASLAIIRLLRTDTPPPPSRHHRSRSRGRRRSSGGADAPPSATPVVRLADEDREGLLEVLRRAVPRFKHHPHVQTVLTTALKVVLQLPGSKILDGTSRTAPPTVAAAAAAATSVVPGRGHGAAGDSAAFGTHRFLRLPLRQWLQRRGRCCGQTRS